MCVPLATVISSEPESNRRRCFVVVGGIFASAVVAAIIFAFATRRSLPAEHQRTLTAPLDRMTHVLFDARRKLLVSGSATGRIVYWNWPDETPVTLDQYATEPITSMTITTDGLLIYGDLAGNVFGWDFERKQSRKLPSPRAPVASIDFRQKELELLMGLSNGLVVVVAPQSRERRIKSGHRGSVKSLAVHPAGQILVTGGSDGRLIWRNARTMKVFQASNLHQSEIGCIYFTPDGKYLVSGDWNGTIAVWDGMTGKELHHWEQGDAVSGLARTNAGLVSAGWDGKLRVWTWDDWQLRSEIETGRPIYDLAAGVDNQTLYSVSNVAELDEWRIQ